MSDVFNGNARDLTDFGEVVYLAKTTATKGVRLSVAVQVETAEGVTVHGEPGNWLMEDPTTGRRWVNDDGYVSTHFAPIDGPPSDLPADAVVPDADGEAGDTPTTGEANIETDPATVAALTDADIGDDEDDGGDATGLVSSSTLTAGAKP